MLLISFTNLQPEKKIGIKPRIWRILGGIYGACIEHQQRHLKHFTDTLSHEKKTESKTKKWILNTEKLRHEAKKTTKANCVTFLRLKKRFHFLKKMDGKTDHFLLLKGIHRLEIHVLESLRIPTADDIHNTKVIHSYITISVSTALQ